MEGIEIIPNPGEKLHKPEKNEMEDVMSAFMLRWRESEFYPWVQKIVDDELLIDYAKDAMYKAFSEGVSLEDGQLARLTYGQFISDQRIRKVKDTIL